MNKYLKPSSNRLDNILSGLVIAVAFGFVGYTALVSAFSPLVA